MPRKPPKVDQTDVAYEELPDARSAGKTRPAYRPPPQMAAAVTGKTLAAGVPSSKTSKATEGGSQNSKFSGSLMEVGTAAKASPPAPASNSYKGQGHPRRALPSEIKRASSGDALKPELKHRSSDASDQPPARAQSSEAAPLPDGDSPKRVTGSAPALSLLPELVAFIACIATRWNRGLCADGA